jgi:uncharacterized protein
MSQFDNNINGDKLSRPVMVIVKRIAKKDKIREFEEWLSGISKEQEDSMGIDIIRPMQKESKPEYVIIFRFNNYIFRFNNYDNLTKWERSPILKDMLQKGRALVEADPDIQKFTGLEFWFTPYFSQKDSSRLTINPPPRYKMAIVTIPVISILLLTLVPTSYLLGIY